MTVDPLYISFLMSTHHFACTLRPFSGSLPYKNDSIKYILYMFILHILNDRKQENLLSHSCFHSFLYSTDTL